MEKNGLVSGVNQVSTFIGCDVRNTWLWVEMERFITRNRIICEKTLGKLHGLIIIQEYTVENTGGVTLVAHLTLGSKSCLSTEHCRCTRSTYRHLKKMNKFQTF